MKKNRLGIMLFAVCLIIVALIGCKGKQMENKSSELEFETKNVSNFDIKELVNLEKENVVISLNDFDYYFFKNNSSITTISFDVYSIKELKKEDIAVIIDTAVPYSYEIVKQEDERFEEWTLMSYLGVNWKELYQMATEEADKFQELTSTYTEKYASIETMPVLHVYNVNVQFDLYEQDFATETISEVDVVIDGKTYKIDGGSITLDSDISFDRDYKGIELDSLAYFEVPFDINREGVTVLPAFSFTATEDFRIEDFRISHPDYNIQSIELQIEENGNIRNEKLDSLNGVEIAEGAYVMIYATVQSENLKNAFSYGASGLQIMEYTLLEENETQMAYNEFVMRTRLHAFDFYGHYIDGVDMLSYYYDYYNPIYGY